MRHAMRKWVVAGTLVLGGTAFAQTEPTESAQPPAPAQTEPAQTPPIAPESEDSSATGGSGQTPTQATGSTQGAGMPDMGITIPKDEKGFLERLHHGNEMEVRLGKLAQEKAQSQQVKDYAKMMVDHHTTADQELMTFAKTQKLRVGQPQPKGNVEAKVMAAHKATEAKLRALSGPAFDMAYMTAMLGDHDMTITKVMLGEQQFTAKPELTQMLTKLRPQLVQHRDQAYQILGQLKPGSMAVGGSGGQAK
jgi:putative membrane protein